MKILVISIPRNKLPEHLHGPTTHEHDLVVDTTRIGMELGYNEKLFREESLSLTMEWERVHPPAQSYRSNLITLPKMPHLGNLD